MRIILFSYDKCVGGVPESGRFHTPRPGVLFRDRPKSDQELFGSTCTLAIYRKEAECLRAPLELNAQWCECYTATDLSTIHRVRVSFIHAFFWQDCRKAKGKSKLESHAPD